MSQNDPFALVIDRQLASPLRKLDEINSIIKKGARKNFIENDLIWAADKKQKSELPEVIEFMTAYFDFSDLHGRYPTNKELAKVLKWKESTVSKWNRISRDRCREILETRGERVKIIGISRKGKEPRTRRAAGETYNLFLIADRLNLIGHAVKEIVWGKSKKIDDQELSLIAAGIQVYCEAMNDKREFEHPVVNESGMVEFRKFKALSLEEYLKKILPVFLCHLFSTDEMRQYLSDPGVKTLLPLIKEGELIDPENPIEAESLTEIYNSKVLIEWLVNHLSENPSIFRKYAEFIGERIKVDGTRDYTQAYSSFKEYFHKKIKEILKKEPALKEIEANNLFYSEVDVEED